MSERSSATKVTVVPGSRVMRKMSASALSSRSGRMPWLAVIAAMRVDAEIRPEHAGAGEAEMRRDQKAVDLLVGVVGEREDDPVRPGAGLAGLHGDAADDAVAPGRRGDADLVPVRAVALDGRGEVDGLHLGVDAHGFDGPAGRRPGEPQECRQKKGYGERYDPQCFGLSSGTKTVERDWYRSGGLRARRSSKMAPTCPQDSVVIVASEAMGPVCGGIEEDRP